MIELRTLGALDLRATDGRDVRPLLRQPKRLALLAYLALAGSQQLHRRDSIVALFWPELDDAHARGALRQALRFVRRVLGDGVVVRRGEEEVGTHRAAVALVHTALGQRDSAFVWLDRAVQERTHWLLWLHRDKRWDPIRSDARFRALVRRVGLPP